MDNLNDSSGKWQCYQYGMEPVSLTRRDEYKFLEGLLQESRRNHGQQKYISKNTQNGEHFKRTVIFQAMKRNTGLQAFSTVTCFLPIGMKEMRRQTSSGSQPSNLKKSGSTTTVQNILRSTLPIIEVRFIIFVNLLKIVTKYRGSLVELLRLALCLTCEL